MKREAVFFDVGSTLLYPSPSVAEAFVSVARERGHDVRLEEVEPHMAAVDDFYEREYARDGDFWCSHERSARIWLDMYALLARLVGLEEDAEAIGARVHACFCKASHWAFYDDVRGCLSALRESGYRLGVISNWDAGLEGLLDDLGLRSCFDDVVASAAVGCRKPDRAVFETALARMGVSADAAVHVGDLPEADGAAAAVGITPVIVDRHGLHVSCPYRRIESLVELPSLLEGLS